MGQKINPHGFRVGVIKDWDSRWYARNEKVGDLIVEDDMLRKYLKKTLYAAGIPKIEIERDNTKVRIYLHCARPGIVRAVPGEGGVMNYGIIVRPDRAALGVAARRARLADGVPRKRRVCQDEICPGVGNSPAARVIVSSIGDAVADES